MFVRHLREPHDARMVPYEGDEVARGTAIDCVQKRVVRARVEDWSEGPHRVTGCASLERVTRRTSPVRMPLDFELEVVDAAKPHQRRDDAVDDLGFIRHGPREPTDDCDA